MPLTKLRPGELFYAANSRGSLPHLDRRDVSQSIRRKRHLCPVSGRGRRLQDLMGGRIAMIVESVGALTGAVQGGSVKPLAVASARRLPNLPDLPTVDETIPGFEAVGWFVLSAPAKTPSAVVAESQSGPESGSWPTGVSSTNSMNSEHLRARCRLKIRARSFGRKSKFGDRWFARWGWRLNSLVRLCSLRARHQRSARQEQASP